MCKFRYILYVLLFVLAGNFCRVQQASLRHDRECGESFFVRQAASGSEGLGLYGQSIFAPEVTNVVQSQNPDQKFLPRHHAFLTHSPAAQPPVCGHSYAMSAVPHPDPVDYYILALRRIVI